MVYKGVYMLVCLYFKMLWPYSSQQILILLYSVWVSHGYGNYGFCHYTCHKVLWCYMMTMNFLYVAKRIKMKCIPHTKKSVQVIWRLTPNLTRLYCIAARTSVYLSFHHTFLVWAMQQQWLDKFTISVFSCRDNIELIMNVFFSHDYICCDRLPDRPKQTLKKVLF